MEVFNIIICFCAVMQVTNMQLLINVKNQGNDIMQENITANISEDTIILEFARLDGVFISQLVDFTNEIEALKVVVPGEEEVGQYNHQTFCFLTHSAQADFIAPDAMAKLRQKNPGTIRIAEEDRGWRQTTATAWAGAIVKHLSLPAARHCAPAKDKVYLRAADLARWGPRPGVDQATFSNLVIPFPERALVTNGDTDDAVGQCLDQKSFDKECICHLEVCVNWYPCGLKYCKGKSAGGLSYRCGIKTCRRCYRHHHYVRRRQDCPVYS